MYSLSNKNSPGQCTVFMCTFDLKETREKISASVELFLTCICLNNKNS